MLQGLEKEVVPLPLTDPNDVPSLERAFGHDAYLMKTFKDANITSIIPLALLLSDNLRDDIKGIGPRTARRIADILAENDLEQRQFGESLSDYIDRQFGCIEDAPIAVLTVVTLRRTIGTVTTRRSHYAPVRLLRLLEERNRHLRVLDLLKATEDQLIEMVEERVMFGPILHKLRSDLIEITWRMRHWEPDTRIGVLSGYAAPSHLKLVR